MFTAQELNRINRKYFRVVNIEEDVVSLISLNTLHGWHIYRPITKYQERTDCIIFHRHENQTEFHKHGYAKTFNDALCMIRQHDNFQINKRWKGKSYKKDLKKLPKAACV